MRCVTGLIKAFHDFTTKNSELSNWNQLHYNKELNKNKQNWIFVVFHDEFHQLFVENTGLLFSSCVDRWMMEHRRRPSVRLQLCRRHINTWLCMCALVHAAASCVNLDSYTCVVDYSTPCYGWLNHRGVDILSWQRWKVQRLRSFFFFVLLFSFWRETTSLFIQSSVFTFILWERALLSCRRMMYGAFIDLLFRIINKNHLCEICPALLLIFDANMNCVSLFLPSLSLHSSLLSPGRHHRRELWARRTHQEPQRERYR